VIWPLRKAGLSRSSLSITSTPALQLIRTARGRAIWRVYGARTTDYRGNCLILAAAILSRLRK
jgi:hypothetical protein